MIEGDEEPVLRDLDCHQFEWIAAINEYEAQGKGKEKEEEFFGL